MQLCGAPRPQRQLRRHGRRRHSLPERAEAGRNYDYRYVWIRHQCYAGLAGAAAGAYPLLDDAVTFVAARLLEHREKMAPAYTTEGAAVPDQQHLRLDDYPGGYGITGNWVNQRVTTTLKRRERRASRPGSPGSSIEAKLGREFSAAAGPGAGPDETANATGVVTPDGLQGEGSATDQPLVRRIRTGGLAPLSGEPRCRDVISKRDRAPSLAVEVGQEAAQRMDNALWG